MANKVSPPIRILHVLAGMNRGGLETYIINLMRRIDRSRYQFDFCVHTDQPCHYDEEIRSLGGDIYPVVWKGGFSRFNTLFSRLLKEQHVDVVHAHAYYFAGAVLRVARRSGVVNRFAHLHTTGDGKQSTITRRIYRRLMVHWIRRHATGIYGCSRSAFDACFGPGWERDPRMKTLYYGVDLSPFEAPVDRDGVRQEFGLPAETPIIIHVGRFDPAKNHVGMMRIYRAIADRHPSVAFMLVGGGGDAAVEQKTLALINELGLSNRVIRTGVRSDVPRLMKAADLMLMPSIREGMPVTLLEATAAGLPTVITDMPGMREANEICCRARLLPVNEPADVWATTVLEEMNKPKPDATESYQRVVQSPFSSARSTRMIEEVYAACRHGHTAMGGSVR